MASSSSKFHCAGSIQIISSQLSSALMTRGIAASDDNLSARIRRLYRIAQFLNNILPLCLGGGAPAAKVTKCRIARRAAGQSQAGVPATREEGLAMRIRQRRGKHTFAVDRS